MNRIIEKHLEEYDKSSNRHIESKYLFIKFITSVSITLLGLLVTLTQFDSLDCISRILFLISISLLVLCILFSLIFLSSESRFHKKEADTRLKFLKEYIKNSDEKSVQSEYIAIGRFYEIFETLTFCCFALWSVSMIFYTYFLIF